jgi:hypothetical protein
MSRRFLMKTAAENIISATAQLANSIVTYAKLNLADGDIPAAKLNLSQTFNFTGTVQKNGVDLATQAYVDSVIQGLDLKDACRAGAFVVRGTDPGEWTGSGNTLTAVSSGPFVATAGVDQQDGGSEMPVPIQLNDRIFVFICTDPDEPFTSKVQDPYAGLYTLTTPGAFPAYAGGTTYAAEDRVMDGGYSYESLVGSNTGNTPVSSPSFWRAVLAHDNTGGPAYSGVTTYAQNALVVSSGIAYVSQVNGNVGNTPASSPSQWEMLTFVPAGTADTPAVITRTTDANSSAEVTTGMYSFIVAGQNLGGSGWVLRTLGGITLNTTPLDFIQFNGGGGGGSYTEGGGIQISGGVISVRLQSGNGLSVDMGTGALQANVDNTSIEIPGSNLIGVKDGGVAYAKLASDVTARLPEFTGDLISTNSGTTTASININPTANRVIVLELVHMASLNADRTIACGRKVVAAFYKANNGTTPVLIGTSEDVIYNDTDPAKRFCDQNSGVTDASSAIDSTFVSFTLNTDSIVPTVNGVQSGTGYSVHHTLSVVRYQQS